MIFVVVVVVVFATALVVVAVLEKVTCCERRKEKRPVHSNSFSNSGLVLNEADQKTKIGTRSCQGDWYLAIG